MLTFSKAAVMRRAQMTKSAQKSMSWTWSRISALLTWLTNLVTTGVASLDAEDKIKDVTKDKQAWAPVATPRCEPVSLMTLTQDRALCWKPP